MECDTEFWNQRYIAEGSIWGDAPSPSAITASRYLGKGMRVLDVGFGYGRDLPFLARHEIHLVGIEPSSKGHELARERLRFAKLKAETLIQGNFEEVGNDMGHFDVILSHRVMHLLETAESVERFVTTVRKILREGGPVILGTRDTRDFDPGLMSEVGQGVYERKDRPGHRIRYWNRKMFETYFAEGFEITGFDETTELESTGSSVACHLTIMTATRHSHSSLKA